MMPDWITDEFLDGQCARAARTLRAAAPALFPDDHDCESCELAAAGGCAAPADAEAFAKINAAMANSYVTQESILELF